MSGGLRPFHRAGAFAAKLNLVVVFFLLFPLSGFVIRLWRTACTDEGTTRADKDEDYDYSNNFFHKCIYPHKYTEFAT